MRLFFTVALATCLVFLPLVEDYPGPVAAQTPPERSLELGDVVRAQSVQTDTLVEMSEAIARIETIVTDTNEKVATKDDVASIMSKLAAVRVNLASTPVVQSDPCSSTVIATATVDPCASTGYVVNPGERIVAIDGVAVAQPVTTQPVTVQQPVAVASPGSTTYTRQGPFVTRTISTTGPASVSTPYVNANSSGGQCYVDANGNTTCPTYNPNTVSPGVNNNGTSRRGIFGRLFRR